MSSTAAIQVEADELLAQRIEQIRRLSYHDVAGMAETTSDKAMVASRECSVTTFVQPIGAEKLLVTVQLARHVMLGVGYHVERGLVFSSTDAIREAMPAELQNSGG